MKPVRTLLSLLILLSVAAPAVAQAPVAAQTPEPVDGPALVVSRLEEILRSGARDRFDALLNQPIDESVVAQFTSDFFVGDVRRAVARERDREPLQGALPGDGYSLIVEFFTEIANHARMTTARIDVRRPREGDAESWRIVDLERLSLVEGLYRLRMDTGVQFAARDFTIESEDLEIVMLDGSVFPVNSDDGITGLVLIGRGEMRFAPPSRTEKGQLRIFSGAEKLVAAFDTAFIRVNPGDYSSRPLTGLSPVPVDPRIVRRAQEVFARDSPRSFNLDLSDMSDALWYLLPPSGDFLADVRTRRFGMLTYARNQNQAEDITLFNRERRRTIALYPSADKLSTRGPSYNEDELTDIDVISYDIDVSVDPERELIDGRARIRLRSRVPYLSTITLRLADALSVDNVASPEFGRLLFLRVRNQNGILVNLPTAIGLGSEVTVLIDYSGHVDAQLVDAEGAELAPQDEVPLMVPERHYLLSNRSYWYPQNSVNDYASARLRIGVPEGWGAVASGQLAAGNDTSLRDLLGPVGAAPSFTFTATEPVRYLAMIISRFVRVSDSVIIARPPDPWAPPGAPPAAGRRDTMSLAVEANPRQQERGRELAAVAEDVLRFYSTLMADTPYPSMTIAVVENDLPGGHSPGYATMFNSAPPGSQSLWRTDPAAFVNYPEFFIAHELAHQWWGQAVGWKNYHEQWISEGFSQYFSALYAQKLRGDEAFTDMLRQFRRWSMSESDEGPVNLGYRLGNIKGDSRVFRALVYNKGAAVLHMLRRLVGDEPFFRGLRRFYQQQRFQKAGTDDFQRAMEQETGMRLSRFFERWINGSDLPRLRYSTVVSARDVVVRFEQVGDQLFDIPVTVTIVYANGRTRDVMVPVTQARVEQRIPTDGAVRQVQVNRDNAALAQFDAN